MLLILGIKKIRPSAERPRVPVFDKNQAISGKTTNYSKE